MQTIITLKTSRLHLPLICHLAFDCLTESYIFKTYKFIPTGLWMKTRCFNRQWRRSRPSNSICCQVPWFPCSQGAAGDQVWLPRCRQTWRRWRLSRFLTFISCLTFQLHMTYVTYDMYLCIDFSRFTDDVRLPDIKGLSNHLPFTKNTHTQHHTALRKSSHCCI